MTNKLAIPRLQPACFESTNQERINERKAEGKQVERLLGVLARKLAPSGEPLESSVTRVA